MCKKSNAHKKFIEFIKFTRYLLCIIYKFICRNVIPAALPEKFIQILS